MKIQRVKLFRFSLNVDLIDFFWGGGESCFEDFRPIDTQNFSNIILHKVAVTYTFKIDLDDFFRKNLVLRFFDQKLSDIDPK